MPFEVVARFDELTLEEIECAAMLVRILGNSLVGVRFFCALENYSFGKVQDSREVHCVRLEIVANSDLEPLKCPTSSGETWPVFWSLKRSGTAVSLCCQVLSLSSGEDCMKTVFCLTVLSFVRAPFEVFSPGNSHSVREVSLCLVRILMSSLHSWNVMPAALLSTR